MKAFFPNIEYAISFRIGFTGRGDFTHALYLSSQGFLSADKPMGRFVAWRDDADLGFQATSPSSTGTQRISSLKTVLGGLRTRQKLPGFAKCTRH